LEVLELEEDAAGNSSVSEAWNRRVRKINRVYQPAARESAFDSIKGVSIHGFFNVGSQ